VDKQRYIATPQTKRFQSPSEQPLRISRFGSQLAQTETLRGLNLPLASVIVLSYNASMFVEQCVRSVLDSDYPNFEVIVVDNGSTDGSYELVRKLFGAIPNVRIIRNSRNLGFAEGNNVGYRNSRGDVLVFLNVDTVTEHDWLRRLVDVLNSDATIGVAQPRLVSMGHPGSVDSEGGYMDCLGYVYLYGSWYTTKPIRKPAEPFYAEGAALAIKRSVAESVLLDASIFDPSHFLYYEDSDLCWRVRLSGHRIVCVRNSIVHHQRAYAAGGASYTSAYRFTKNHIATLIKNYGLRCLLKWLPLVVLFESLSAALLITRAGDIALAKIRAIFWCLMNFRQPWEKHVYVQRLIRRVPDSAIVQLMLRPDFRLLLSGSQALTQFVQGR